MSGSNGYGSEVFSSGQVAKICHVAARTISKWIDAGRLHGYRIPGSQDRRVTRENLVRFLRENDMPLPPELEDEPVTLGLGVPPLLCTLGRFGAVIQTAFDAGLWLGSHPLPVRVVIDPAAFGRAAALAIIAWLAAQTPRPAVVVLLPDDGSPTEYMWAGATETVTHLGNGES